MEMLWLRMYSFNQLYLLTMLIETNVSMCFCSAAAMARNKSLSSLEPKRAQPWMWIALGVQAELVGIVGFAALLELPVLVRGCRAILLTNSKSFFISFMTC